MCFLWICFIIYSDSPKYQKRELRWFDFTLMPENGWKNEMQLSMK